MEESDSDAKKLIDTTESAEQIAEDARRNTLEIRKIMLEETLAEADNIWKSKKTSEAAEDEPSMPIEDKSSIRTEDSEDDQSQAAENNNIQPNDSKQNLFQSSDVSAEDNDLSVVEELRDRFIKIMKDNEDISELLSHLDSEIDSIKSDLKKYYDEIESLKEYNGEHGKRIDDLENSIQTIKDDIMKQNQKEIIRPMNYDSNKINQYQSHISDEDISLLSSEDDSAERQSCILDEEHRTNIKDDKLLTQVPENQEDNVNESSTAANYDESSKESLCSCDSANDTKESGDIITENMDTLQESSEKAPQSSEELNKPSQLLNEENPVVDGGIASQSTESSLVKPSELSMVKSSESNVAKSLESSVVKSSESTVDSKCSEVSNVPSEEVHTTPEQLIGLDPINERLSIIEKKIEMALERVFNLQSLKNCECDDKEYEKLDDISSDSNPACVGQADTKASEEIKTSSTEEKSDDVNMDSNRSSEITCVCQMEKVASEEIKASNEELRLDINTTSETSCECLTDSKVPTGIESNRTSEIFCVCRNDTKVPEEISVFSSPSEAIDDNQSSEKIETPSIGDKTSSEKDNTSSDTFTDKQSSEETESPSIGDQTDTKDTTSFETAIECRDEETGSSSEDQINENRNLSIDILATGAAPSVEEIKATSVEETDTAAKDQDNTKTSEDNEGLSFTFTVTVSVAGKTVDQNLKEPSEETVAPNAEKDEMIESPIEEDMPDEKTEDSQIVNSEIQIADNSNMKPEVSKDYVTSVYEDLIDEIIKESLSNMNVEQTLSPEVLENNQTQDAEETTDSIDQMLLYIENATKIPGFICNNHRLTLYNLINSREITNMTEQLSPDMMDFISKNTDKFDFIVIE